jgi:AraC-like DNA-binding protein
MATQEQTRDSRQTRTFRDPEGAASIMFPERRLLDLAQGRIGMSVDVLRLTHAGLTLGRVVSVGHEIMLEDPENVTLLLPVDGHIAVRTGAGDQGFGSGSLILAQSEKRWTRVVAPKGGVFRAVTVQIARSRLAALTDAGADRIRRPVDHGIRAIDTTFGQRVGQLLPGLADVIFRKPDRFLTPRAQADFVNLIGDLLGNGTGTGGAETRVYGGLREFQRVSQACDMIHTGAEEAISIAELAIELGVTPRSLQLSFQAIHGMSPRQYLQRVRLDRARKTILDQGDAASVTKAAMNCGFMHLSRFSQLYRRTFGELPSETASRRHGKPAPKPMQAD